MDILFIIDNSLEKESSPAFDALAVDAPNDSLATVSSLAELDSVTPSNDVSHFLRVWRKKFFFF